MTWYAIDGSVVDSTGHDGALVLQCYLFFALRGGGGSAFGVVTTSSPHLLGFTYSVDHFSVWK